MKKSTAQRISDYLRTRSANAGFDFARIQEGRPLDGFHQWADGRPLISADRVEQHGGRTVFFLVIDWYRSDDWYLVLYRHDAQVTHAEISHEDPSEGSLHWSYKPKKGDGLNVRRTAYFRNHVGDAGIHLAIPATGDDGVRFVEDLFGLVECRVKADLLDPQAPEMRRSFPEGEAYERRHLSRERNSELIRVVKENAAARGPLVCQVCTFDFSRRYGVIGQGYIEAHHVIPVSELGPGAQTRPEEIALVCANCHRMLHRRRPWLKMSELANLLVHVADRSPTGT